MKLKKGYRHNPAISPERDRQHLEIHLKAKSLSMKTRLGDWLGEDVKISSFVDAENMKYTMVFLSKKFGRLGSLELIYGGYHVSPLELRCVLSDEGPKGREEREALMKKIYDRARNMFHCQQWQVYYYRDGEEIGTLEFNDEYSRRARNTAFHRAPPGCDTIELLTPKGKIMVKTDMDESGQWEKVKAKKLSVLQNSIA
jgi:hypothetical protein